MMVCSCGSPLDDGDIFCGNCGKPRSLPTVTVMEPQVDLVTAPVGEASEAARQPLGTQYFTHATARPPEPMSNATRYLCAAAYLDSSFSNGVIRELLGSHRAVVPSRGIDLIPIIRH